MIARLGFCSIAVVEDEPTAEYPVAVTSIARFPTGGVVVSASRALVELQLFQGGLAPHVMVGGSFTPVPGLQCVEVQVQLGLGPRRSCRSLLSGRRLFAGLSDEYVEPVIEGLQGALATGDGIVTIDRFGFDPVDTSAYVGELTASILGRALSLGRVPEEDQAAAWLKMVR